MSDIAWLSEKPFDDRWDLDAEPPDPMRCPNCGVELEERIDPDVGGCLQCPKCHYTVYCEESEG